MGFFTDVKGFCQPKVKLGPQIQQGQQLKKNVFPSNISQDRAELALGEKKIQTHIWLPDWS